MAANPKPRLRLTSIGDQMVPVEVAPAETPLEAAKRRFGQPFAHEPDTKWQPRAVPFLTEWLQKRGRA